MYLFTRAGRLVPGNLGPEMNWALSITEKVNQVTELDVTLWTTVFSAGVGSLTWVCTVEDLRTLENSDTKLMNDAGFQLLVDEGAHFTSAEGLNDSLAQFLTPMPTTESAMPNYASVVRATVAPGHFAQGIEVGLAIAEHVSNTLGRPTMFLSEITGRYGGVSWMTGFEDIDQLQAAQQAIAIDAALVDMLDQKSSAYMPHAEQTCYRRIC